MSASFKPTDSTFSDTTYKRLYNVVESNTRKISDNVKKMGVMFDELQTCTLNSENWKKFQHLQEMTTQTGQNTSEHLKKINAMLASTEVAEQLCEKQQTEELATDFEKCLNSFTVVQRQARDAERKMINEAKLRCVGAGVGAGDNEPGAGTDEQMQLLAVKRDDMEQLLQRESELQALEESIMNVNQIFKDLQSMVQQQGEVIDRIEDHIEQTAVTVTVGNEQLVGAVEKQTSSRKKKMFCGIIIAVVVVVLIVVIALSFV